MKRLIVIAGAMLLALSTAAQATDAVQNWSAPSSWAPTSAGAGRSALATYKPLPFVPITPCRLADTRAGSGFPAGYGPPSIGGGATRTFVITGQCGIPASAQAVSFNFAVWAPTTRGDLRVFPAGGAAPVVSTLNWEAGILALANAAVVPLSVAGAVSVLNDGTSVDIFIDVNGFYGTAPADPTQFFTLNTNSGLYTMRLSNASTTCLGPCGLMQNVASGIAIEGLTTSPSGGDVGVLGLAGAGLGVQGISSSNVGVQGLSTNLNGVWAQSTNQDGLFASGGRDGAFIQGARFGAFGVSSGTSGQLFGVIGQTASTTTNGGSAGVRGVNATGTSTNGFALNYAQAGVQGVTGGPFGYGVLGVALGTGNIAGLFANQNTVSPFAVTTFASLAPSNLIAGTFIGNVGVSGTLSKGAGSFKIDHPLDPENKYLYHSFVESPDMMNIYNGIVELDAVGEAIVQLPDYFEALNSDFRYQLTSIGRAQANLFIADEVQDLKFRIAGGKPFARVSWQVTGIRKDAYANAHRIQVVEEKEKDLRGTYMHPVEHGKPAGLSEFFTRDGKPILAGQRAPAEK